MVFNCTNSLSGKGVFIDAEEPGRECVELPIKYFTKLLKRDENEAKSEEKIENEISVSTKL